MLTADVISTDATLNNFDVINSLSFIPGEQTTLFIRLKQDRKDGLRYMTPSTTIFTFYLPKKDGTVLESTGTVMTDDRSIWSTTLQEVDTEDLIGGNFTFDVDLLGDGSKILKGWVQNGLILVNTGAC
jgi:hypothetical protein